MNLYTKENLRHLFISIVFTKILVASIGYIPIVIFNINIYYPSTSFKVFEQPLLT